jgi:antitoxin VapB
LRLECSPYGRFGRWRYLDRVAQPAADSAYIDAGYADEIYEYPLGDIHMPLYIRDNSVDALAGELQTALKVTSKTEAVRIALQHELARARQVQPIRQRLAKALELADAMGLGDPTFSMKDFTDQMWDEG